MHHSEKIFKKRGILTKNTLIHGAYWILVTGFFLYEKRYLIYKANLPYFFACVSGRILLLIIIAYLNLHYFLPKYLAGKRYVAYGAAILLSLIAYLFIQTLYDFYLYGYVVGPMYNSNLAEALSYNFFSALWYLGLMLALKLSLDWYGQQLLIQRITVEKLNAEVDFLRAQVNPHFLFNILNNLYALTLKKSDLAPDVVLKLSAMMEYMLYDSNDEKVLLGKELTYLHNYIELERLRFNGNALISLSTDPAAEGQRIAPLLLLPVVENAFKHGLGKQTDNGWLKVNIDLNGSVLTARVENSKPAAPARHHKGGIGLDNLHKRLELLYPGRHRLQLEDSATTYKATLVIDL
ncbi:histidine kinase [Mucilaginibacter mali]|uniref:Histidine kinase n=1 Tax=Mucilaginibacter mali TaxID=2740462 RepID=A0A7D4TVR1_9SPHI|nr:histidine kinase [Mucilaginibacter mali]QKJ30755.1 histidine kinase [Mucilaginibacter mali]